MIHIFAIILATSILLFFLFAAGLSAWRVGNKSRTAGVFMLISGLSFFTLLLTILVIPPSLLSEWLDAPEWIAGIVWMGLIALGSFSLFLVQNILSKRDPLDFIRDQRTLLSYVDKMKQVGLNFDLRLSHEERYQNAFTPEGQVDQIPVDCVRIALTLEGQSDLTFHSQFDSPPAIIEEQWKIKISQTESKPQGDLRQHLNLLWGNYNVFEIEISGSELSAYSELNMTAPKLRDDMLRELQKQLLRLPKLILAVP